MIRETLERLGIAPVPARFPNMILRTHRNDVVRFYDDLLKDRIVMISFMYTRCEGRCPPTIATMRRVQEALAARPGPEVLLHSITLDPVYDTPAVLGRYAAEVGAGPRWRFITGSAGDIESIRRRLGFVDPDPRVDADKSQHAGLLLIGNDRLDRWAACPAAGRLERILKVVSRISE
jgi:protein SCO1/2